MLSPSPGDVLCNGATALTDSHRWSAARATSRLRLGSLAGPRRHLIPQAERHRRKRDRLRA
eukprot:7640131-Alexandrium_andersonii.AAC.1